MAVWARALVVGLGVGVLFTAAHALLPDPWAVLAGTSALWGVAPMVVARRAPARASAASRRISGSGAVTGLAVMVGTLVPWLVVHAARTSGAELALWLTVGPLAGAVCGAAGAASVARGRRGAAAAGVVPGIVAGEAVYGLLLVGGPAWILELALAVVLLAVVSPAGRRSPAVLTAAAISGASSAACLGYDLVLA